ncbi:MAG: 50S ribosomal protein L21 [Phycisphaerales bacterium]|jgi:large subunit ribosomal protein L21|nr:50S ribosomal protein L21 [Phycisphaerales bacterium]
MYAIIQEGGGQRKVSKGDVITVDLLDGGQSAVGSKVNFDKVLLLSGDGVSLKIGQPYVGGASVSAEVVEAITKGPKLTIQRFKRRKAFDKKTGHRQKYTTVKITDIKG